MIEEIYNEADDVKMPTVSSFLKQLYPHKNVEDILIDTAEFDPPKKEVKKEVEKDDAKPEIKSRKERRFLERKQKKSEKSNKTVNVRETEKKKDRKALDQIKEETRVEIGKRLAPILFGIK